MSISQNQSKSKGSQSSGSTSTPTNTEQYADYFRGLDTLTGGRLNTFATQGTQKLTPEQIQAYGGLGATRTADVNRQRAQAIEGISADPNLTIAQRQRSTQLTDQDVQARLDAINKEVEAGITGLAQYNNTLTARDLELLAQIYYGGKAQTGQSWGVGSNQSLSSGTSASISG